MNRNQLIVSDATHAETTHGQPGPFVIDLASQPDHFKTLDNVVFDVSSRFILPGVTINDYLKTYFMYLRTEQIDTVFGNAVYPSKLYGGRPYKLERSITDGHVTQLQKSGIGLSLTLTNHFFDKATYESNLNFLQRFHQTGNTIVCTNDELAHHIRQDFPFYKLKASLIKHLNTVKKVEAAFRHYDYVVIPMDKNDDEIFLRALPEKNRVYLFGNASCAYNCPSRSCYVGISQRNQHQVETTACSIPSKPRADEGHIYFDVHAFQEMGYSRFKMVPNGHSSAQFALQVLSQKRPPSARPIKRKKPVARVFSYPKSGRSWLRFLLANYCNKLMQLGLPIDFQTVFTLFPNAGSDPLKGDANYQFWQWQDVPLITFSHQPLPPDPGTALLVLRSIPDVLVSEYFHQTRLIGNQKGLPIDLYLKGESGGLERHLQYLNQSIEHINSDVTLMTYESLKNNPHQTLSILLETLAIAVKPELLDEAIEQSSFETMQVLERSGGIAGHNQQNYQDQEARRVRKGQVGGYTDYLSPDLIHYCRQVADEQLSDAAKSRLADLQLFPF